MEYFSEFMIRLYWVLRTVIFLKRYIIFVLLLLSLSGCANQQNEDSHALTLRSQLMKSNGCSFDATITADYGEYACTFTVHAEVDSSDDLKFTVLKPDSISGITGTLSKETGYLTFDDKVLLMQML